MMKILLIEDDISDLIHLEMIVDTIDNCETIRCNSIAKAEIALLQNDIDLAIVDIRVDNGQNALKWMQSQSTRPPFVVTSAEVGEDNYKIASTANALSILVKPVDPENLKYIIEKVMADKPRMIGNEHQATMVIKDGSKTHLVGRDEVIWVETESNYSTIKTAEKKIVIKRSMRRILKDFELVSFQQVSRSAIVNPIHIKEVSRKENIVIMRDDKVFTVSRSLKTALQKRLVQY